MNWISSQLKNCMCSSDMIKKETPETKLIKGQIYNAHRLRSAAYSPLCDSTALRTHRSAYSPALSRVHVRSEAASAPTRGRTSSWGSRCCPRLCAALSSQRTARLSTPSILSSFRNRLYCCRECGFGLCSFLNLMRSEQPPRPCTPFQPYHWGHLSSIQYHSLRWALEPGVLCIFTRLFGPQFSHL